MERVANRGAWLKVLKDRGWDGVLAMLQSNYPDLRLYAVSKDWARSDEFILKAKGASGDLLVTWR